MQLNLLFITFTLLNITPNQLTSATNNLIPLDIAINNTCKKFNINILFEYILNKKITPIPEHFNLEESITWIKKQTDTNFEKSTNSYIFYNNSHSESPIISTSQAIEYTRELQKCLINIKFPKIINTGGKLIIASNSTFKKIASDILLNKKENESVNILSSTLPEQVSGELKEVLLTRYFSTFKSKTTTRNIILDSIQNGQLYMTVGKDRITLYCPQYKIIITENSNSIISNKNKDDFNSIANDKKNFKRPDQINMSSLQELITSSNKKTKNKNYLDICYHHNTYNKENPVNYLRGAGKISGLIFSGNEITTITKQSNTNEIFPTEIQQGIMNAMPISYFRFINSFNEEESNKFMRMQKITNSLNILRKRTFKQIIEIIKPTQENIYAADISINEINLISSMISIDLLLEMPRYISGKIPSFLSDIKSSHITISIKKNTFDFTISEGPNRQGLSLFFGNIPIEK